MHGGQLVRAHGLWCKEYELEPSLSGHDLRLFNKPFSTVDVWTYGCVWTSEHWKESNTTLRCTCHRAARVWRFCYATLQSVVVAYEWASTKSYKVVSCVHKLWNLLTGQSVAFKKNCICLIFYVFSYGQFLNKLVLSWCWEVTDIGLKAIVSNCRYFASFLLS